MTGKLNSSLSKIISIKKAKILGKKLGVSFNEIVMAICSKAIKKHFVSQNDDTEEISATVPFTFNSVPHNPLDYTYQNNFISITIFLPLESCFETAA